MRCKELATPDFDMFRWCANKAGGWDYSVPAR